MGNKTRPGRCVRKALYMSGTAAKLAAAKINNLNRGRGNPRRLRAYQCDACLQHHLTSERVTVDPELETQAS